MCRSNLMLEAPKYGYRLARERVVHSCRLHCKAHGDRILLFKADEIELLFSRVGNDFIFCCWKSRVMYENVLIR